MIIKFLGHSCIMAETNNKKILFDPFDPKMVGLPMKKQKCDFCCVSHSHADHNYVTAATGAVIIDKPAAYHYETFDIEGYPTFHDPSNGSKRGKNIVFKLNSEGFSFAHMGDIGFLDYNLIKKLTGIDILALPIGGNYTIDANTALEYVKEISPAFVIPIHYSVKGCKIDISSADAFLKAISDHEIINTSEFNTAIFRPKDKPQIIMLKNINLKD